MKKYKNKKGFTLIELLAVIVILAVLLAIAIPAVTSYINNSKKDSFISNAKFYIDSVRNDNTLADDMPILLTDEKMIRIADINLEKGEKKSAYGNDWVDENSYVVIRNTGSLDFPKYTYYIALEDEKGYCLELTDEASLERGLVKKGGCIIDTAILPDNIPVTPEEAFTIEDGVITSYDISYGTEVNIPSSVNGMTVTAIDDYTFENYSITKLVLPDTITRIGDCAFINSTELKKVIIPNSVTFIGNGAFAYAPIEQLKLGTSVQVIDDYAFELAKITSLTLPDSVTSIGVSAFANAELKNLKISNNLVTVEEGAFSHSVLTELTLPDTLQTIGVKAFQYSTLSELIIPASVQSIGDRAFRKSVLESLTIQGKGNSNCLTTGEGKFTSLGNDDVFGWKDGENIICEP